MKQKIHFLTYGDSGKYHTSKKHIVNLAKISNIFDESIGYSRKNLDEKFLNDYSDILKIKRGGGLYIWKQRIIYNHLKSMNKNDLIFYSDAGSSFNPHGRKRFLEYIDLLNDSIYGNLRFENKKEHVEMYWTTKELFNYFNLDINSVHARTPQLMGGHLLFQNNEHTSEFFEIFFKTILDDPNLVSDYYTHNQIEGFNENRHDQSIMSLISKLSGSVILENETFFEKQSQIQYQYPILSVRNYGHGIKDRIRYILNIKNMKNEPVFF